MDKIKEVVLDLDDFQMDSPMQQLIMMKEHYPDFKVSCFVAPLHKGLLNGQVEEKKLHEWAELINSYDWIEVCPHGLAHMFKEVEVNMATAEKLVWSVEKMFDRIGLKYKKIWKSPHWQTSNAAYKVLRDAGYVVATDRNQEKPAIPDMKQYRFNWSIDEPIKNRKVLKAHGHMVTTKNSIVKCLPNLMEIPADVKWITISEYLKKYGQD